MYFIFKREQLYYLLITCSDRTRFILSVSMVAFICIVWWLFYYQALNAQIHNYQKRIHELKQADSSYVAEFKQYRQITESIQELENTLKAQDHKIYSMSEIMTVLIAYAYTYKLYLQKSTTDYKQSPNIYAWTLEVFGTYEQIIAFLGTALRTLHTIECKAYELHKINDDTIMCTVTFGCFTS